MPHPLKNYKPTGSTKSGSHHWLMQRLSAVALIPLSVWFIIIFLKSLKSDYSTFVMMITTPLPLTLMLSSWVLMFYHALMGIQVVMEDYIPLHKGRLFLLWFLKGVAIFIGLLGIVVLLTLMMDQTYHPSTIE